LFRFFTHAEPKIIEERIPFADGASVRTHYEETTVTSESSDVSLGLQRKVQPSCLFAFALTSSSIPAGVTPWIFLVSLRLFFSSVSILRLQPCGDLWILLQADE
jgi:hypothetical protein